jgi:hypothetical protein
MKLSEIVPVFISVTVILFVAAVQRQSKAVAAVTATMPLTIPLTLWIVYSSSNGERAAVESFTRNMVSGIVPTMAFALAVWVAARSGFKLVPMIAFGYSIWALTLLVIFGVRRLLGG